MVSTRPFSSGLSVARSSAAISDGELTLKAERIRERAVVAFRPEMPVVARVDQLHADDDAISSRAHASLQHVDHAERLRNLRQIAFGRAAVGHHRGAADYLQVVDFRQARQDVVLDSVGKKRVLLVVAEIFERQNGDALFGASGSRLLAGPKALVKKETQPRRRSTPMIKELSFRPVWRLIDSSGGTSSARLIPSGVSS